MIHYQYISNALEEVEVQWSKRRNLDRFVISRFSMQLCRISGAITHYQYISNALQGSDLQQPNLTRGVPLSDWGFSCMSVEVSA